MARSYNSSVFSFLRNLYTVFHSDYTNLCSHQQCTKCSFFSTSSLTFIISSLFEINILTFVTLHLIVVLICISILTTDFEHVFLCLLVICMFSLESCHGYFGILHNFFDQVIFKLIFNWTIVDLQYSASFCCIAK